MADESGAGKGAMAILADGQILFSIKHPDGTETKHEVDLLVLKVTCEKAEDDHQLQTVDGRIRPTAEFLVDLAGRLATCGLPNCTPTHAWQAWIAVTEAMATLKNSISETPS